MTTSIRIITVQSCDLRLVTFYKCAADDSQACRSFFFQNCKKNKRQRIEKKIEEEKKCEE